MVRKTMTMCITSIGRTDGQTYGETDRRKSLRSIVRLLTDGR